MAQFHDGQEIKLIKSAIQGYEDALARGTRIDGGELTPQGRAFYARQIVELQGKMATILGGMVI